MATETIPEEDPLEPGEVAAAKDVDLDREDPKASDPVPEDGEEEADEEDVIEGADLKELEYALSEVTDETLIARKIISADRGYSIEQLQQEDPQAWEKASQRFLTIAGFVYRTVVTSFLPGVGEEDAKSAAGEIVLELGKNIANYPSLPQLEKAFRTALRRDLYSLQRKFLAEKRGGGRVDVTSELQGLEARDDPDGQTAKDKNDPSGREGKIKAGYAEWDSLHSQSPSEEAVSKELEAERARQLEAIEPCLSRLKPAEQELLKWAYIDGLSQQQIAYKLGKNVSSVGIRILRAAEKLRKSISVETLHERIKSS